MIWNYEQLWTSYTASTRTLVENAQDAGQAVMLQDVDVEVGGGVEDGEEVGHLWNTG